MRGGDDGGYAKPLLDGTSGRVGSGPGERFGASGQDDFGGDFTKVDFDKPLFDIKQKDSGVDAGGSGGGGLGYGGVRSLYSSSSAA